jgi:hypothetical protein
MVDAAVGSKSVLGRAIESVQGLVQAAPADFKYMNFESMDLARASKENKSNAITGFGGEDRGTPGEVSFEKKVKYDLTVDRILIDLAAEFGKPTVTPLGSGILSGNITINDAGTDYEIGDAITFAGTTGSGAAATVATIGGGGEILTVTFTNYGTGYTGPVVATVAPTTGSDADITAEIAAGDGSLSGVVDITTPGTNYVVGDAVTFAGTSGSGAAATISAVGSGGEVLALEFSNRGSGYSGVVNANFSAGSGTSAVATAEIRPGPWLVMFRPGEQSPVERFLSMYSYEGGSYTAMVQQGRRCGGVTLADAANKRVQVDPDYTEPTGDTISGFPIAKTGNAGTQNTKLLSTRGRRPYDANYEAGKSLYLKVSAVTPGAVVFLAAYDTPSGETEGTGFPAVSFGSAEFTVPRAGWGTAKDSNDAYESLIGLFGENNEPYEITIGDQDGELYAADDIFEIPAVLSPVTKVVVAENRLSTFHLTNAIGGASVLVDSGTTKWTRPYKEYYSNSRRFPSQVDPTGDIAGSMSFKKRLFDIAFRKVQEQSHRVAAVQSWAFGDSVLVDVHEGIEVFYPQMRVDTMKSGDVPNKNTLEETITLMAEQPDAVPVSQPVSILTPGGDYFDLSAQYPYQINVVCLHDPSHLTA